MPLVTGVSGVNRMCPMSIGLRKAQAMAPPVVLTMSRYMFIQKGAAQGQKRDEPLDIQSSQFNCQVSFMKIF